MTRNANFQNKSEEGNAQSCNEKLHALSQNDASEGQLLYI